MLGGYAVLEIMDYINKIMACSDEGDFEDRLAVARARGIGYAEPFNYLNLSLDGKYLALHYNKRCYIEDKWYDFDRALMDCKGLVIDLEKSEVVLRPYTKFFRYGEREETSSQEILRRYLHANRVQLTEQMDGSLICARMYGSEVIISTSGSNDLKDNTRIARAKEILNKEKYIRLLAEFRDYTLMFENISLDDRHIVDYIDLDIDFGLYLHGIRHVGTGQYMPYNEIAKVAREYKVHYVEPLGFRELSDVLEDVKQYDAREKEGYILYIDGFFVKIKCPEYLKQEARLQNLVDPNGVIKLYADGQLMEILDDIYGPVRERVDYILHEIREFETLVSTNTARVYGEIIAKVGDKDRKAFFVELQKYGKVLFRYVSQLYLKHKCDIWKGEEHGGKYLRYKDMQKLLSDFKVLSQNNNGSC